MPKKGGGLSFATKADGSKLMDAISGGAPLQMEV